jgi:hypothetical protein
MATLTAWAQAVRAEAERSRLHSVTLRTRIHEQIELSERRRAYYEETLAIAELRRNAPVGSAWSDLPWQKPARFDDVLELVES